METMGKRLNRLRIKRGLSLKQVAEQLNISASTYRDWEYGKAIQGEPYMDLAKVLNIGIVELMTGSRSQNQDLIRAIQSLDKIVSDIKTIALSME
ncbi:MAG: helix-turn-helix transcriptional regulator [Bdellovibrionota bacterium]